MHAFPALRSEEISAGESRPTVEQPSRASHEPPALGDSRIGSSMKFDRFSVGAATGATAAARRGAISS